MKLELCLTILISFESQSLTSFGILIALKDNIDFLFYTLKHILFLQSSTYAL